MRLWMFGGRPWHVVPRTGTATSWSLVCAEKTALGGGSFFHALWEVFLHCDDLVPACACLCAPAAGLFTLGFLMLRPPLGLHALYAAGMAMVPQTGPGVLCEQCQSGFECSCTRCMLPTARKGPMKHRRVALSSLVVKLKTRRDEILGSGTCLLWIPEEPSRGSVDAGVPKPTR